MIDMKTCYWKYRESKERGGGSPARSYVYQTECDGKTFTTGFLSMQIDGLDCPKCRKTITTKHVDSKRTD